MSRLDEIGGALLAALVLLLAIAGCGSVTAGADAGDLDSMLSPELAPDRQVDVEQRDAAADVEQRDAAADVGGPSCSWDCLAVCYCGALPCCRSTTSSDCCTR